jgi:starch-binding outer membrane protein, SusD/RagB family
MKKNIAILASLLIAYAISGCKKYTDITPRGSQIVETAQDYYELVSYPNRAYLISNFQYLVDDMWLKESNFIGMTPNINTVHFSFDENVDRVSMILSSNFYDRAYLYINRWNTIISSVDASKGDNNIKALAKAEAKALRAFDHFLLVNVYAKAYNAATATTDGGICIMDKYDLEAQPTKSTVAQVYEFIQKDIDEAIPYLQAQPTDPYHPSLAFAWALKAKIHLFKREIAQAKAACEKSLSYNNQIFDLVKYTTTQGGPTVTPIIAPNNPEVLSYQYIQGYNETNFGFTWLISPELRVLFGNNDARFNMFFNTTNASFLDIGSNAAYYNVAYTRFFYPTVGLKTTEVYLMQAECLARENDLAGAMAVVNALREKRILSGTIKLPIPATRKETMEIIINERRKEMVLGFNRFFDLKRLNTEPEYAKTIVRTYPLVNKTVPQKTYTLLPGSRLYIIPFPLNILKKNPNLTLNTDEKLPF